MRVYQGEDGCWYYDQWVRGHYRKTKNGEVWIEGHYRRALYLHPDNRRCCFGHYKNIRNCFYCPWKASCFNSRYGRRTSSAPVQSRSIQSTSDNCFIATATYGTPMAKEVIYLKKFRDNVLRNIGIGRWFISVYYTLSPPVAKYIENKPKLQSFIRTILGPVIKLLKKYET